MYITKKDAEFYCFETIALATICMIEEGSYIGEERVKELIQNVSDSYGVTPPKYRHTRKDSGFCYHRCGAIHFNPKWGLTTETVLHELAHYIDYVQDKPGHRHGVHYVRIWMDVFARHYNVDVAEFEELAKKRGLEFSEGTQTVCNYKPKYG